MFFHAKFHLHWYILSPIAEILQFCAETLHVPQLCWSRPNLACPSMRNFILIGVDVAPAGWYWKYRQDTTILTKSWNFGASVPTPYHQLGSYWHTMKPMVYCSMSNFTLISIYCCPAHWKPPKYGSSLDWVLSHWAHFTVLRFIFACIMCIIVYCLHV